MKRRRSYFLSPSGAPPPGKKMKLDDDDADVTVVSSASQNAQQSHSNATALSQQQAFSKFFSPKNSTLADSFPARMRDESEGPFVDGKRANRTIVSQREKPPRKKFAFGPNIREQQQLSQSKNLAAASSLKSAPESHFTSHQAPMNILPIASPKRNKSRPVVNRKLAVMHPPAQSPPMQKTSSVVRAVQQRATTVASKTEITQKQTTVTSTSTTTNMKQATLQFQNKRNLLNSTSDLSPMKPRDAARPGTAPLPAPQATYLGRQTLMERVQTMGTRQVTNANNVQKPSSTSRVPNNFQPSSSPDLSFNTGKFKYRDRLDYQRLSKEQKFILDQVMISNGSVFFTGAAGCGKSHLLRTMVEFLKEKHGEDRVFVTASTGIAGCNIGGTTVHSFAGIGIGKGTKEQLAKQVASRKQPKTRWKMARVLVIDEISMLEAELLDKLDFVARHVRGKPSQFFGGIQVILVGDFFQLPPVTNGEPKFCFEADCWKQLSNTFVLTQVFRQKNPEFVKILNEMRVGQLSAQGEAALRACINKRFDTSDGIEATQLFPLKRNVEQENLNRLAQIADNAIVFESRDRGSSSLMTFLDKNCQAPAKLTLKKNAQVVLLKNMDFEQNLVNGSRGVVTGFHDSTGYPMVRFEGHATPREIVMHEFSVEMGRDKAIREQIPLNLAFSMSIHKAQGMTLNRVSTSLREVFAPGQAYVSVSRVTSLEGLCLTSFDPKKIHAHPKVKRFYEELLQQNRTNYQ